MSWICTRCGGNFAGCDTDEPRQCDTECVTRPPIPSPAKTLNDLREPWKNRPPVGPARGVTSQPGNALEILSRDRDVWKKRALEAEESLRKARVELAERSDDIVEGVRRSMLGRD